MRLWRVFPLLLGLSYLALSGPAIQNAKAGEPPALCYHFEAGHKYVYDTQVAFATPGGWSMIRADHVFSVVSQSNDRMTILLGRLLFQSPAGNKSPETFVDSQQSGRAMIFIPHFGPSSVRPAATGWASSALAKPGGAIAQSTAVFSLYGDLISGDANSRLPKLLGFQDQLMLEPLPPQPKSSWRRTVDVSLVLDDSGTTCPAKEETRYSIVAVKGAIVHLVKNYSLRTDPDAKNAGTVKTTGFGNLDFDTGVGLFRSLAMTYVLEIARDEKVYSIQLALSTQLLDEKELPAREEKAKRIIDYHRPPGANVAEARARAAQILAEANIPKPFTAEVRASALRDLKIGDRIVVKAALIRLKNAQRDDRADEVSAALVEALSRVNEADKAEVLDALAIWATVNSEPAVIQASKSMFSSARDKALDLLGSRFKDDAAIEAIVAQFRASPGVAAAALKKVGPAAEKSVLPLLKENDFWIRGDVIGILREIGGERSLRALRRELKTFLPANNLLEISPFNDAIAAIQRRLADEDKADMAKPGGPKSRFWADLSETYEIEATLVGVKDHNALLQQKGGRQLAVPLEKLSEEDQEYIKRYLKAQADAKPENPFQ